MVIGYLRISTDKQFLENQRSEILRFAEQKNLSIDKWCSEVVSGSVHVKERKLAGLLKSLKRRDVLIVTELSRLSRTLLEMMNILNICIDKEVVLYSTKEGYLFQNDINSKVLGFAFGLVAEIERNLISMRTKEALHRRKREGKHLGRKHGSAPVMKHLGERRELIGSLLTSGMPKVEVARKMSVSLSSLKKFLKN